MNNEYFINTRTNTRYARVNRRIAQKAFNCGYTVIITPVNVNPLFGDGAFLHYCSKDFDNDYDPSKDFDRICNSMIYYNCCYQLGYYLKYYLPVSIAVKCGCSEV